VREVSSFLGAVSLTGADTLNPAVDTIPADRIATLVTERGPIDPMTADAVQAAARD
jgi:methylthioribose-1-phosphate isomerase